MWVDIMCVEGVWRAIPSESVGLEIPTNVSDQITLVIRPWVDAVCSTQSQAPRQGCF